MVWGEFVWRAGAPTGKRPGRVLLNRGGQVTAN
jgi:hypothetical protein